MKGITFLLKTLQPLLATSFQGDPNSDVSYSYLPGSMIRGALIGRYLSKNGLKNADILTNDTVRRLFFDGTTRYLNAYLHSQKENRTFPTLLSWHKEKGDELKEDNKINAYDFSVAKPNKDLLQTPKRVREEFWVKEDSYVRLYSISRRINIHHSRDRRKGRATATEGEIFRYDAIDAGQTFQGVILYDRDEDRQTLQELLESPDIWLGGSRSAGYGHVEISETQPQGETWQEIDIDPEDRSSDSFLKITLLSDLILRDNSGQPVAMPPTQLIADKLEIELSEPKIAYMDSTFIAGFNRKWGLPLPQVPAVKAGSVFVYEGVKITAKQIKKLEVEGLGERKVEGFGRVAVNWPMNEDFELKKPDSDSYINAPQLQTQNSQNLAKQMGERIVRQKLENHLLNQVNPYRLESNHLTNSQLSRLILVTRKCLDSGNYQDLHNLIENLPSNARRQYEKTTVGGRGSLLKWLEKPEQWLEGRASEVEVAIAGQESSLTENLTLEYTLRLIMAIAKNAIRENQNE